MTKATKTETQLSRRKLLGRIGVLAAASYTVPAFTTLSMAQAGSKSSGSSKSNASSAASASSPSASSPSVSSPSASGSSSSSDSSTSGPSSSTGGGTGTAPTPEDVCGPANLGDATYDQCLIDNGFTPGG